MTNTIKFFYNGIKVNGGKLQKSYLYKDHETGTITIYARNYTRFSKEIQEVFQVENNTDIMTDYFENDTIRVKSNHPLYAQVLAAYDVGYARREKKMAA